MNKLTSVANVDPEIHCKTYNRHDYAEESEKNPIFTYFSASVSPDEGDDAEEPRHPLSSVDAQLFDTSLFLLFALLLLFPHFSCLHLGIFPQTLRVTTVHL